MQKSVFAILFSAFMIAPALAQETATPASTSVPAAAQSTAEVHPVRGQVINSADGHRVGQVYAIRSDGAVQVIYKDKLIEIAPSTLSAQGDALVTSLTRQQLNLMTR